MARSSKSVFPRLSHLWRVRPLTLRLLGYVVAFSLLLSMVAGGIQVAGEYRQEKQELLQVQQTAASLVAKSLAPKLWQLRMDEARQDIEGLLSLPGIHYVSVRTPGGQQLEAGEKPAIEHVQRNLPLTTRRPGNGEPVAVGTLHIASSLAPLHKRLWDRGLLTLLLQALILMIGALGLLLIVRGMLTRHLAAMADFARQLDFDALVAPLRLKRRPPRHPDELSDLERALNTMRLQLLEEARRLQRAERRSQGERDRAVEANQAKDRFLARISHELRTPLQSVLGYTSLLEDTELNEDQREYTQTLRQCAENLSSTINDLVDISRIEAGRLELAPLPFSLRETVQDLVAMLAPRAREKALALEYRIDPDLPAMLEGDPVRIRQILTNLVTNAIKFTDSGHVLIAAELLEIREGRVRLRLAVEDTGQGITPEQQRQIRQPYVQAGKGRPHSGAGLGLTVCHQLADLMDSRLEVESEPGRGSTFWLDLSLRLSQEAPPRARHHARTLDGARILVADSYALSRKITLELLDEAGAEVEAVDSAAQALQALSEARDVHHPYAALVLDGFLPDMDCARLCVQLRQSDLAEVRILVLSANPQRGDAEHFRAAGADGFLSKSLRESYLPALLHRLLVDCNAGQRLFVTRFSLQDSAMVRPAESAPCADINVLLVEDNPVNRDMTRRLLEKLQAQVVTASSGEEAEEHLRNQSFDLVFMDCMLPGQDGYETTRKQRQRESEAGCPPVPIVALTASVGEAEKERCRAAGMDDFIAKPVKPEQLRTTLARHCRRQEDDSA